MIYLLCKSRLIGGHIKEVRSIFYGHKRTPDLYDPCSGIVSNPIREINGSRYYLYPNTTDKYFNILKVKNV